MLMTVNAKMQQELNSLRVLSYSPLLLAFVYYVSSAAVAGNAKKKVFSKKLRFILDLMEMLSLEKLKYAKIAGVEKK